MTESYVLSDFRRDLFAAAALSALLRMGSSERYSLIQHLGVRCGPRIEQEVTALAWVIADLMIAVGLNREGREL